MPILTREHTEKYWISLSIANRSRLLTAFNNANPRNASKSNKADNIHKFLVANYSDEIRLTLGLSI